MIAADDIKSARAKLNESQSAFGERFGVDQSTVHRWETAGPPKQKLVQDGIRRVLDSVVPAPQEAGAGE